MAWNLLLLCLLADCITLKFDGFRSFGLVKKYSDFKETRQYLNGPIKLGKTYMSTQYNFKNLKWLMYCRANGQVLKYYCVYLNKMLHKLYQHIET